jgi:hypothetical protein
MKRASKFLRMALLGVVATAIAALSSSFFYDPPVEIDRFWWLYYGYPNVPEYLTEVANDVLVDDADGEGSADVSVDVAIQFYWAGTSLGGFGQYDVNGDGAVTSQAEFYAFRTVIEDVFTTYGANTFMVLELKDGTGPKSGASLSYGDPSEGLVIIPYHVWHAGVSDYVNVPGMTYAHELGHASGLGTYHNNDPDYVMYGVTFDISGNAYPKEMVTQQEADYGWLNYY